MSMIYDEYGRPFVILREQQAKSRVKGKEATKSNILAARTISKLLRSSLGPKGLDKLLVSPDGDVTITNDGATILQELQVDHQVAKLMVELSSSQDNEIGDGTTGVVVLAGALLEQSENLIKKGIHPIRVAEGFEKAAKMAIDKLKDISESIDIHKDNHAVLKAIAKTTLSSKILQQHSEKMVGIAVDAVLQVADLDRGDVNFEHIRVEGKTGGSLNDTTLVNGIIIDKEISHPQMPKEINDVKMCILTCPFEPPKPKTKHKLDITSRETYELLHDKEQEYFTNMVQKVKDSGANLVICQWGFDDEANHLLLNQGLPAVRWVGGVEIEHIAMATDGRIIPRFEDISPEKLGKCGKVKEITFGTRKEKMLVFENCSKTTAITILVRGSNKMIIDEAKRSLHDAMCVVRNLIRDNSVVYGGGSAEVACSLEIRKHCDTIVQGVDQYALEAFANALEDIPLALAENSGYSPIEELAELKNKQIQTNCSRFGLSVNNTDNEGSLATTATTSKFHSTDMRDISVFESLVGKQSQIQLATQVVKMILKIDDVICGGQYQ